MNEGAQKQAGRAGEATGGRTKGKDVNVSRITLY